MKAHTRTRLFTLLAAPLFGVGCGVEGFFAEGFDDTNPVPSVRLSGSVPIEDATVEVVGLDGEVVDPLTSEIVGQGFDISLPLNCYQMSRVRAVKGEKVYQLLIPHLSPVEYACGSGSGYKADLTMDAKSTAVMLIVEARASADGRALSAYDPTIVNGVLDLTYAALDAGGPGGEFVQWVGNVLEAASENTDALSIVSPGLTPDFQTSTSALDLAFMKRRRIDFDGDGEADTTTTAIAKFDARLAELASGEALSLEGNPFSLEGCLDPALIRVVFEVDFNEGLKDGNCVGINRFKWVTDEQGKRMFFVGGIHEESVVQDPVLDRAMGNAGSWQPNTVPMYDDGTNGDAVAGDNIWTIYFDMPPGTRVGYKYTWGNRGDLWTGTEEWPGNQRILEAVDVNGDNFVFRRDNFQDEATNKDKSNLYRQGNGSITWDTDADGDGIPDAQERPIDTDNDCTLDKWMTPAGVGPATVDCADI